MVIEDSGAVPTGRRSWPRRALAFWRSVPVLVRAATAAFIGVMVAMTYLYPVNYGFDEPQHFDMAYSFSKGDPIQGPGKRFVATGVTHEVNKFARHFPPDTRFDDDPIPGRAHRGSIESYGDDEASTLPNQMVQHPPLYYLIGAAVLRLPGIHKLAYDIQFSLLRLLSLLFVLPLPLLCWLTARRLGAGSLAPCASLVPLLLPALARSGAEVTNDSLLELCSAVLIYLLVRVATGDSSWRTTLAVAAATLAGLLTKGFALVLPPLIVLSYLLRRRRTQVPAFRQLLVAGVACGVGGLWWLHNLVAYGAVQPNGAPGRDNATFQALHQAKTPGQVGHVPGFLYRFGDSLVDRFWGSIGLIESPGYNAAFAWIAMGLLALLVVAALVRMPSGTARAALGTSLLVIPLTIGVIVAGSWRYYHQYLLLVGVQGRYLYTAIVPVAAAAMIGISVLVPNRFHRWIPVLAVGAIAYAQLWTAKTIIGSWWITSDHPAGLRDWWKALEGLTDWSPWPIGVTLLLTVVVAASALWLLATALRIARRGEIDLARVRAA